MSRIYLQIITYTVISDYFHCNLRLSFSTQLPQAVGVAYSLKMEKKDACAVAYTGDGGTSEVITSSIIPLPISFPWDLNCPFAHFSSCVDLGRFSCRIELCSSYGSPCRLHLSQQWLGH